MASSAAYPAHREADVVLRDGSTVHVRPVRPEDAAGVRALFEGLSAESGWLRFFSGAYDTGAVVRWATEVDYDRRFGLVATAGAEQRLVAHAGWERLRGRADKAELALAIADDVQGRGLGTILLGQLAEAAPADVPVLAVVMSAAGGPLELRGTRRALPSYAFPEDAARALARAAAYGAWRSAPEGQVPELAGVRRDEAAAVLATAMAAGPLPRWLGPDEVAGLLGCYGLPLAPWRLTGTPEEAAAAAAELGGPVALKAVASGLVHKSEAGAVRLALGGAEQVAAGAHEMASRVAAAGHQASGFLVQRMAEPGVELLVGVVHDPSFGPVVACGAGGTAVELLKDVAVRITPLTDLDARQMVRSLATFPLLDGYRGAPKADVAALEDVLLRVSALVDERPEVAELDCNPVVVGPGGAVIVDARIRIEQPAAPPPLGARRRP